VISRLIAHLPAPPSFCRVGTVSALCNSSQVTDAVVSEMAELARTGQGDAFAMTHDSFAGSLPKLPGARVLPGNFQMTGIGVAVPKGRAAALKVMSGLLDIAKKFGVVRNALDAAGFRDAVVAP
jgi:polar amino acid transport system substrate-binding protein